MYNFTVYYYLQHAAPYTATPHHHNKEHLGDEASFGMRVRFGFYIYVSEGDLILFRISAVLCIH